MRRGRKNMELKTDPEVLRHSPHLGSMEEGTWLCKDQKGERARSWKATKQACREKATSNIPGSGGVEDKLRRKDKTW